MPAEEHVRLPDGLFLLESLPCATRKRHPGVELTPRASI